MEDSLQSTDVDTGTPTDSVQKKPVPQECIMEPIAVEENLMNTPPTEPEGNKQNGDINTESNNLEPNPETEPETVTNQWEILNAPDVEHPEETLCDEPTTDYTKDIATDNIPNSDEKTEDGNLPAEIGFIEEKPETAEPQPDKSSMSLDQVKNMIENITSGINTLKAETEAEKKARAKVAKQEKKEQEDVEVNITHQQEKEIDFDYLRMRNDQLRQELLSIKKEQELRGPVKSDVPEQKIVASCRMNKLKDSTYSLEKEIELINKARRAQESLKKRHEERREVERKKRLQELGAEDVSVEDMRANIQQLKAQMEAISNLPVGDVMLDDPDETEAASGEGELKESKAKQHNKKVHDEMMRKYLMTTVMQQNVKALSSQLNKMLTNKPTATQATEVRSDPKAEMENDEYYMYPEGSEGDLEPYEEDQDDEEDNGHEVKKQGILESTAKTIDIVSSVINKDNQSAPKPQGKLSKSQKKKLKKKQAGQPVQHSIEHHQQSALSHPIQEEKSPKSDDKQDKLVEVSPDAQTNEVVEASSGEVSESKLQTYNLILKLQTEMASMQLQITTLQSKMRSANAVLKEILSTEFANI